MARQIRIRKSTRRPTGSYLTAILSVIALVALMATPALAHHNDGHDNGPGSSNDRSDSTASDHDGDADSDSNTAYTEDNDTNDGGTPNNVADEGDNAHPSGKDRSVEHGGSNNQGKSESNPDDSKGPMRYEGALGDDKPNGPGGTDLADQDGNNGCGNDDDFDDDNNGWCGKPKTTTPAPAPSVAPVPSVAPAVEVAPAAVEGKVCPKDTDFAGRPMERFEDCNDDDVLGVLIQKATPKVLGGPPVQVASAGTSAAKGAVLPFTGGDVTIFLALGLALIAIGALTLKVRTDN
jgi:hypothetical protein